MKELLAEFREYWAFKPVRTMFYVRFLSYLTIFISPFWGMILAIYFDGWDWDYLQKYKMPKKWYHRIDKVVDYIMYIVITPLILTTPIVTYYIAFLAWRTLGMILYFVAKIKSEVFILFPNVAEYLALAYFMSLTFSLGWNVTSFNWIVGIVIFKLIIELQLHYFQIWLPIANKAQPKFLVALSRFNARLIK